MTKYHISNPSNIHFQTPVDSLVYYINDKHVYQHARRFIVSFSLNKCHNHYSTEHYAVPYNPIYTYHKNTFSNLL